MDHLPLISFQYQDIAFKTALASGIGLLVGLEREWSHKEIGVRTFAIGGLLGMLTSLLTPLLILGALTGVLLMVVFLNVHSLLKDRSLELTTSICMVVVFFLGVLVGADYYFTAATSAIVMMMLLAWKRELERFAGALRPEEIRSAVLICLLTVVIYPLLPDRFVDPWQLVNPRQFWVIILVIAGIGFLNYVLLRLYSTRGMYYSALLGGLVNSTAAVVELAAQFRGRPELASQAIAVLLLTNISMFARNVAILAIFAPKAIVSAASPLAAMALATAVAVWSQRGKAAARAEPLHLTSPVSLKRVIKFSLVFFVLACSGTLAQRYFGSLGFLFISILGGMVSSASTTATAAALATTGRISPATAGLATILTSIASSLINLPLVYQRTRQPVLFYRFAFVSVLIAVVGVSMYFTVPWLNTHHWPIVDRIVAIANGYVVRMRAQ